MSRLWYRIPGENDDIILASRIRLLRNFDGFHFKERNNDEETAYMTEVFSEKVRKLSCFSGSHMKKTDLSALSEEEKDALQEKLLINKSVLAEGSSGVVYVTEDEAFSMTLGGTDHLRMILSCHGQGLQELFQRISGYDDSINSAMPYAFSDRFGYKTASIANMGTGMRAYYLMHLPLVSEQENFTELRQEIGKYGVVIKEAWSTESERIGGMYILYNQRTLGLTEESIMDILTNVAEKLMNEERRLRSLMSSVRMADRVHRAYGILRYAGLLGRTESLRHLSDLMLGCSEGYLRERGEIRIYELMLAVQPGNLQTNYGISLETEEAEIKRAEYLREAMEAFLIIR